MFGFGKKKAKENTATQTVPTVPQNALGEELVAPSAGQYKPLSAVADPVFAQGMMGDGYAIDPVENTVVAPISGELALLQDTLHAFMIRSAEGAEILVHIGIDTVELGGKGFSAVAEVGTQVTAGQPIVTVDWEKVKDSVPSQEVMVMVTNSKSFGVAVNDNAQRTVAAGEHVAYVVKK